MRYFTRFYGRECAAVRRCSCERGPAVENVVPLGMPRFLAIEDENKGYRLPAGSIVMGNIWGILHNEAMYPDPYSFKPERFLLDGKLNPDVRDPEAVFGFGRRYCDGYWHFRVLGFYRSL
ncbi:cytochrome P450 [Mycena crocata]|nr:cytochrome P450 [Mycena crocata]